MIRFVDFGDCLKRARPSVIMGEAAQSFGQSSIYQYRSRLKLFQGPAAAPANDRAPAAVEVTSMPLVRSLP